MYNRMDLNSCHTSKKCGQSLQCGFSFANLLRRMVCKSWKCCKMGEICCFYFVRRILCFDSKKTDFTIILCTSFLMNGHILINFKSYEKRSMIFTLKLKYLQKSSFFFFKHCSIIFHVFFLHFHLLELKHVEELAGFFLPFLIHMYKTCKMERVFRNPIRTKEFKKKMPSFYNFLNIFWLYLKYMFQYNFFIRYKFV